MNIYLVHLYQINQTFIFYYKNYLKRWVLQTETDNYMISSQLELTTMTFAKKDSDVE
jgi:hypothetical protein